VRRVSVATMTLHPLPELRRLSVIIIIIIIIIINSISISLPRCLSQSHHKHKALQHPLLLPLTHYTHALAA